MENKSELRDVADVLNECMAGRGIYDDWDEVIIDMRDQVGYDGAVEYAKRVQRSIDFVNRHSSMDEEDKSKCDFVAQAIEYLNFKE